MDVGKFHPGNRRYYGPKDGRSRTPIFPRVSKALTRTLTALVYKREVSGKENIPKGEGYVFSPNHENTFDPVVWRDLAPGDTRGMVTMDIFENPITATAARLGGAFPVDRFNPSLATLQHSVDIIAQGANEIIYPQGGFREDEQIGGIFKGASRAALDGNGKGIVPIGIHIEEASKKKLNWKDALLGGVIASTVGALALAGAPLVAGAVAGAAGAVTIGVKAAKKLVPQRHGYDPMPNILSGVAGGAVGTAVGAVAGAVAAIAAPVTLPLMAVAGIGGAAISRARRSRPVAKVSFEKLLRTEDYRGLPDAADKLTSDLHESIAQAKSKLSGVPIDRSLPVFGYKPWQIPE